MTDSTTWVRSRWLVLVAMTGSLSMVLLDQTVVTVALPTMSRDLDLSGTGQTWVVNAYVLAIASLVAGWALLARERVTDTSGARAALAEAG